MKSFSLLIISLLITHLASAQEKVFGASGGFHLGLKSYDTENYQFFMPDDAAILDNGLVTLGGDGYVIFRNWLVGGSGFYSSGDRQNLSVNAQSYEYKIKGGSGYLNLGYVMFHGSSWFFFPQAGIGIESLSLVKTLDESTDFSVQDNFSARYNYNSPMLQIGFGFDFFPLGTSMTKFGIRAGYQLSLQQDNEWQHAGGGITGQDLPENNLNGFFVNLVIGGGYFIKR